MPRSVDNSLFQSVQGKLTPPPPTPKKIVNRVYFVLDASGSMDTRIAKAREYLGSALLSLQDSAFKLDQETYVSVRVFSTTVGMETMSQLNAKSLFTKNLDLLYPFDYGGTALYDTIAHVISTALTERHDENLGNLLVVLTDGRDEHSTRYNKNTLRRLVEQLGNNWTLTVAGPESVREVFDPIFGAGNVTVWDGTNEGLDRHIVATARAVSSYSGTRSTGAKKTAAFYSTVTPEIVDVLTDVTDSYRKLRVKSGEPKIEDFINGLGLPFRVGAAYYELDKPETIQGHKEILLVHKKSGRVYGGNAARKVVGLMETIKTAGQQVKVTPGNHGDYRVFVQSTSNNRKLVPHTTVLWPR